MSFESLVKKLMKEGKSKTAATKIAGSVANAKMKGAGSGPTAKQKARAKSPATKKPKPRAVIRDKDRVADKSRSYTDKKGKKIEIKTFNYKKRYDSGVKEDPNDPSMKRKSSRLSNTVELHKTKTKKDGTTKTKVKRAAGGGKKSQKLHTKFAKGKNKEGSSDVTITRKSPTTMKKQMTDPKKTGERKPKSRKTSVDKKIDRSDKGLTKVLREPSDRGVKAKSPAKKPLVGGQKKLPKELQEAILKSPGKMLTRSAMKMMDDGSPATMSNRRKVKKIAQAKGFPTKKARGKNRATKEQKMEAKKALESMSKSPAKMKTPMKKSKQKVEQDYARNAIADYKSGKTKEAKYEKKKALEVAAGESPAKMKDKKKPVTKTKTTTAKGTKVKNKLKKGTIKVKIKSPGGGKRKFAMNTDMESLNTDGRQTLSDPQKYKNRRKARKGSPAQMQMGPDMKKIVKAGKEAASFAAFGPSKGMYNLAKKAFKYLDKDPSGKAKKNPMMMKTNPMMMKTNQDGGAYAAKNPAAPARQLKKLGSVLSKHFKSNK